MKKNLKKIIIRSIVLGLVIFCGYQIVLAATFTLVKDTLNRVKANEVSGITHKVIFTTVGAVSGGAGINKVIIVTPDDDDNKWCRTAGTDLVATGCTDETSTALPGTLTAKCVVGSGASSYDIITVEAVNDLTATTKYCVDIVQAGTPTALLGTDDTAGSHAMTIKTNNGTVDIDQGDAIIHLVTDDTVVTTATVPASLSFDVVGDETMGFGTLSTTASRWADTAEDGEPAATAAHTITAGTNSTGGYSMTVKGDTLKSTGTPTDTITAITTEGTLNIGSEEFGLRITSTGGTGITIDTAYDNSPVDTYYYGGTASTADSIAVCAGASATTTYSLFYAANIAADTEAHTDYTASLTYVATGTF
jgi:hypothetical protein